MAELAAPAAGGIRHRPHLRIATGLAESRRPLSELAGPFPQQRPVAPRELFLGLGQLSGRGRNQRAAALQRLDRKSTRLNSSHTVISYAVFCLKKKIV